MCKDEENDYWLIVDAVGADYQTAKGKPYKAMGACNFGTTCKKS